MFVDQVKVHIKAGKGGDGLVSFRHEKYVAYGGPFGGDGGNGGDVIFEADPGMTTLLDLRYHRKVIATPGEKGKNKKMHGANGEHKVVKVPLGTIVKRSDNNQVLADLTKPHQRQVVAHGGRGGRGNWHFRSSHNTAPKYAEQGILGEEFDCIVELRVLADVGLVGFPSVGKSTFLDAVSKARPEIGDYPFTTITPNVGVVQTGDGRSFLLADLPGLIEGASDGKGLGHQFLRHIERCRVIVHIIDMGGIEGRDPYEDYCTINEELGQYQYRLLERPQIVVANKMDEENAEENLKAFKEKVGEDVKVFPISAIIHEGVDQVLYAVADALETAPKFDMEEVEENTVVYNYEEEEAPFVVHNLGNGQWTITGKKIERLVSMTSLVSDDAIKRLSIKMRNMGIDEALRNAGCQDGDVVSILDFEFEFYD